MDTEKHKPNKKPRISAVFCTSLVINDHRIGRREGTRTPDPHHVKVVL